MRRTRHPSVKPIQNLYRAVHAGKSGSLHMVRQNRSIDKLAPKFFSEMPAFDATHLIIPTTVRNPIWQKEVATKHRSGFRQPLLDVSKAVESIGWAKEHIVLFCFPFCLYPRQQVRLPKGDDVCATVLKIWRVAVVREQIHVVSRIRLNRKTPLAHVALAYCFPGLFPCLHKRR